MREDIRLEDWRIWADGPFQDDFLESIFFCGGGRMGVRGYAAGDPRPRPVQQGLFLAGMFDEIKPGITDVIHLPTPVWHHLTVNGEEPAFCGSVRRTLELDKGLLRLEYRLQAAQAALKVTEERFFDPERPALLAQRLTVEPQAPARLRLESGIYSASRNCPGPDDQVKENTETMQLMEEMEPRFEENALTGRWRSRTTGLELRQELTFRVKGGAAAGSFWRPGKALGLVVEGDGGPLVVEKTAALFTSRDKDPRVASAPEEEGWEELLAAAQRHWARRWQGMDLQVEGDETAQAALRYLAYQLTASCSGGDDTVNIGARGLTHARYKGCYFWDTDLFMLPFFLYTQPASARSLAQYRVNCLPQAKAHAKKMNGAGARYPWMASFDGSEQCESWDIGASEVHITADVAYALDQYLQTTGDESFAPGAREVFVETARFWRSRYTAEPGTGRENLLFCKGPDEYCGITSNNLFTGEMVRHNLDLALAAAETLRQEEPERYAALGLTEKETEGWRKLREAIPVPRDPATGRLWPDDTFHLLEPVDPAALKEGDEASYHKVCFDRLQRYQVIKQADTLLLMTRLPDRFTGEEKKNAWEDFEPKCLHDSTLSFASHALFAAQNRYDDAAWRYFEKALYLDLREVMGNTGKEGLHLAGLGETWQAAVFGFAGLRFGPQGPTLSPRLPTGWKSLRFRFYWRGRLYEARADQKSGDVVPCETDI